MDKRNYLLNMLNEAISETSSDFETFDDYKKGVGGSKCFVYTQVDRDAIDNVCLNGADGAKEFMNFGHMYYGRGIYCTMSYDQVNKYHEGNAVIEYAVKTGGFDNFLIFDMGIRKMLYKTGALTIHEKISSTIKRLFSKEDFEMLERYYGRGLVNLDNEVMSHDFDRSSWNTQERFLNLSRTGENYFEYRDNDKAYPSEYRLDTSNVDGFCYYAGDTGYGPVAIFRTTDILIPYRYSFRGGSGGYGSAFPPLKDWKYCFNNSDNFNQANHSIDAFRRFRKDYPKTGFTDKTIAGLAKVSNGKKFNLVNSRTGQLFSPLNFDTCNQDLMGNEVNFDIDTKDPELGVFKFKVTSKDFAKDFEIYACQQINDEHSPWEEIDYPTFVATMEDLKSLGISSLNESTDEVFTHMNHQKWSDSIAKKGSSVVKLYRASAPDVAKSEYYNGPNFEFTGTGGDDSLYYGFGVYTVRDLNSILGGKYGNGICEFVLKDGYKDFVILDDETRAKNGQDKTVYDTLKRLVPSDILKDVDYKLKNCIGKSRGDGSGLPSLNSYTQQNAITNKGIEAYKDTNIDKDWRGTYFNTASFARALKLVLQGHNLHDPLAKHAYDELILAKTGIRGFVYNGGSDGKCCLVRDFNSLMPVRYSEDGGRTWKTEQDSAKDEERFNTINQNVHPWYQYKNEYPMTDLRQKRVGNFSMVRRKEGYNFKDIWFHRPLLPIDVDSATVEPMSGDITINVDDFTFIVKLDDDMNATIIYCDKDDEGKIVNKEIMDYEDFIEALNQLKEIGAVDANKTINNNCLLNPATKRNK